MPQSLIGHVIVASTLVTESVFERGVLLMMHHDDSGAIGVMLNRPISPPPAELIRLITGQADDGSLATPDDEPMGEKPLVSEPQPSGPRKRFEVPAATDKVATTNSPAEFVHFGGPLSGPVFAIHDTKSLAEGYTASGIYVAAQKESLEQLVRDKIGDYRLMIGHAGWTAGQLETEIDAGMWHILPASSDMIFGVDSDIWPMLIRRATASSISRWIGAPDNPVAAYLN